MAQKIYHEWIQSNTKWKIKLSRLAVLLLQDNLFYAIILYENKYKDGGKSKLVREMETNYLMQYIVHTNILHQRPKRRGQNVLF